MSGFEQINDVPSKEIIKNVDGEDTSNMEANQINNHPTGELLNNQELAEVTANKAIEGVKEVGELSPEQQKKFIELVEPLLQNIDGLADLLPNRIPESWQKKFDDYLKVESNISKLPPDKQEKFKKAREEALIGATEQVQKVINIDLGATQKNADVTKKDTTPDEKDEPSSSTHPDERHSDGEAGGVSVSGGVAGGIDRDGI